MYFNYFYHKIHAVINIKFPAQLLSQMIWGPKIQGVGFMIFNRLKQKMQKPVVFKHLF